MLIDTCYYGDKADMWSIGCILLELVLGHEKFCLQWCRPYAYEIMKDVKAFQAQIAESVEILPLSLHKVSEDLKDFAMCFLRLQASERKSFKQLASHPWLKSQFAIDESEPQEETLTPTPSPTPALTAAKDSGEMEAKAAETQTPPTGEEEEEEMDLDGFGDLPS
eukprot:gene21433-21374_t